MREVKANPRGTGGGRLISPSALPLPGILFCLFLSLSLGPDPMNEIIAEIFSVQDTRGIRPFPWLQWVAESLPSSPCLPCVDDKHPLHRHAKTLGGPLVDVSEMENALCSLFGGT